MAEYIDRIEVMKHISPIVYKDRYITNDTASKIVYEIQSERAADVVERSKYDTLHNLAKSWLEEKKELGKANDELRSKIDKAIERIKHIPLIATRNRVTIYKSGEDILKEVLDILETVGE